MTALIETSGGEFCRRGKGDHTVWRCANGSKTVIPKPLKRRHTANAILKQAGIDAKV